MQVLCSTGVFTRGSGYTDHRAILKYGPLLDVDGFEIMFYRDWYPHFHQVVYDLQLSGLKFPAIHAEKKIGVVFGSAEPEEQKQGISWFTDDCIFACRIGAKIIILHLWDWPPSDEHFERNLQPLKRCIDIANKYNLILAVETLPCKLYDPLHNIALAIAHDERCCVALDSEFLASHSQLDAVFDIPLLWDSNRVQHIHIKDFDGQPFFPDGKRKLLHPGEGTIDFARLFQFLKQKSFGGSLSLEAPALGSDGHVDIARIQESLHFIRQMSQFAG